ncbi:hypothetical protein D3C85_1275200 [compost metagenome]
MLEYADHQRTRVAGQNIFRAIAVVYVKVDNRHAFQPMVFQRMQRRDGHVAEEAKTHGLAARGMVARRAHRAERVFQLAREHRIGGRDAGARSVQRGWPGMGVDGGIGIDLRVGRAANQLGLLELVAALLERLQIGAVMGPRNVGQRRRGGLAPIEGIGHPADQQPVLDRVQPCRTLRMPGAHLVFPAFFMGEIARLAHCHVSRVVFSANVVPCKHSTTSNRF